MTIRREQKTLPPYDLLVISETDAVGIAEVQSRLNGLWRQASENLQEEPPDALALASLWNLVAFHSNPQRSRGDSGGEAGRIESLLEEVTLSVPGRVIHLEEWRDEPPPQEGREVEAWVSTHCRASGGGGHTVCCESINLAGYGEKGHRHFPALVRALLVSHLPVALLWMNDVPQKGRLLGQLMAMSDRLIVDCQHTTDPASLVAVQDLMKSAGGKIVDMGWLRLAPLRHLVAGLFDPPDRAGQLDALEGVTVETSQNGKNTGLMLAGWILSRCGVVDAEAVDLGGREHHWRWNVRQGERSFPLDFSSREGYGGLDEIFRIEIRAGGDAFELQDVDPEHMSVAAPHRNLPSVALREGRDAELVVGALGSAVRDRVFAEALAMAARLVESQQWTQ